MKNLDETVMDEPVTETVMDEPGTETVMDEPGTETVMDEPVTETVLDETVIDEPGTEPVIDEPGTETVIDEPGTETVIDEPGTGLRKRRGDSIDLDTIGKTPRTRYAQNKFGNNKHTIHLLGHYNKYQRDDEYDDEYVLFQVPYKDETQFIEYENLDLNHDKYKKDCAIQSMFSLGLQDVELSKQCSSDINMYGEEGVTRQAINDYIKRAFGLSSKTQVMRKSIDMRDVTYDGDEDEGNYDVNYYHYKHDGTDPSIEGYNFYLDTKLSTEQKNDKTVEFFHRKLKNGYATTISIMFLSSRGNEFGHRLVVYNHDDKIYFFDPQQKLSGLPVEYNAYENKYYVVKPNGKLKAYISQNLYDLIPSTSSLDSVYCIIIRNLLEETKPLIKTDMLIGYVKKK
jgi:hypothetical protein